MRHLLAGAAPNQAADGAHLAVTAKVQIFAERSKSGRVLEVERSGTPANGNMIGDCAVMLTKRKPPERSG